MLRSFHDIQNQARQKPVRTVAIAAAEDPAALEAIIEARKNNIARGILIGNKASILDLLTAHEEDPGKYEIIEAPHVEEAARIAAHLAAEGRADIIMKGKLTTSKLLKAVLAHDSGLTEGTLLSDVVVFEDSRPGEEHLTLLTDGGVNIAPDAAKKAQIIRNAVRVAHSLGNPMPKVAVVSAAEYVVPAMQSTVDAEILKDMNLRGEIGGCQVDGPFGLDNAISVRDAALKGVASPMAGKADILLAPSIEAGNMFAKGLVYYGGIMIIHVIIGARVPIIICSRTDPPEAKLMSLALASAILP